MDNLPLNISRLPDSFFGHSQTIPGYSPVISLGRFAPKHSLPAYNSTTDISPSQSTSLPDERHTIEPLVTGSVVAAQWKCQQFFFKLTTNQNFDIVIMIVILLNMTTMAMEHHDEPEELTLILNFINQLFIAVFTLECVMKLDHWAT